MKKVLLPILFFSLYFTYSHAQNPEIIHVQDLSRKTGFYLEIYPGAETNSDQKYGKMLFKVYSNGKNVCADGNVMVYVDFQERDLNGKRETLEMYNQESFNCKGYYSFYLKADSINGSDILFERYKKLTTKKIYALIFSPYYKNDPNKIQVQPTLIRVNIDANSDFKIRNAIKKYVIKK